MRRNCVRARGAWEVVWVVGVFLGSGGLGWNAWGAKPEVPPKAGAGQPVSAGVVPVGGVSWGVADAPFRFTVTAKTPPAPAEAGWAIEVPDLGHVMPQGADVVVQDAAGKVLPAARYFRSEGLKLVLLVPDLQVGQSVSVYFGGGVRRNSPEWPVTKPPLFREVRRMAPGVSLDSLDSVELAWRNAQSVEGADFCTWIAQNENPYGEGVNFLTRYRGWLMPGAMRVPVFTASSDASFVRFNGKVELSRPGKYEPILTRDRATEKVMEIPAQGVLVDYLHAKGADPGIALTRLGYFPEPKRGAIFEKNQWAQAGVTEGGRLEHRVYGALPPLKVEQVDYIGWEGMWFFDAKLGFEGELPAGVSVTWRFGDGARVSGATVRRLLSGLAPVKVVASLARGTESMELGWKISNGGQIKEALTTRPADRDRYLERMMAEDLGVLDLEVLKNFYRFTREFGTDQQIGKMARAWIAKNPDVSDPLFIGGVIAWLRGTAQAQPKKALEDLAKIDAAVQKKYLRELGLFELDTRVFLLRDEGVLSLAEALLREFQQEPKVVRRIQTRVGDLRRLQGKVKEAETLYRKIQENVAEDSAGRKYAAQDRAFSVTVANHISNGDRMEAEAALARWESERPEAKLSSDFLLLQGRGLMMFGRWGEALQEIDSFRQMNPDSPFEIPANFYRAKALFGLGRVEEAKKIWTALAASYPKHELAAEAQRLSQSR